MFSQESQEIGPFVIKCQHLFMCMLGNMGEGEIVLYSDTLSRFYCYAHFFDMGEIRAKRITALLRCITQEGRI